MAKKKNYLNNEDLKEEILKCITSGYNRAVEFGFSADDPFYDNEDLFPLKKHKTKKKLNSDSETDDEEESSKKEIDLTKIFIPSHPDFNKVVEIGFMPERSIWIKKIRTYNPNVAKEMVNNGDIPEDVAKTLSKQMVKPIVSDKLGRMFMLIVDNVARSFYWANPDDGEDCKANALLDLCSGFWKFEPVDANGKPYNAFAFCTQMAYFGIAGAHRILHNKKYEGTISMSCIDENGKSFDLYNI